MASTFERMKGLAICLCVILAVGCSAVNKTTQALQAPIKSLSSDFRSRDSTNASAVVLQSEVMRFADQYADVVAQAADQFIASVSTIDARIEGQRWKVGQATAAAANATETNPQGGLLDMVVLASLSCTAQKDYWAAQSYGPHAKPLLDAHVKLEAAAWEMARRYLNDDQQKQLREMIAAWRKTHPGAHYVAFVRLRDFAEEAGVNLASEKAKPNSIFSMLYIDPFAGLDPTARAIDETRATAERAMYYFERMPMLVSWQAELLSLRLAAMPESRQLLADADRLSKSSEIFAKTAEKLPQVIAEQREAAINQLFAELQKNEKELSNTFVNLRQTLMAGTEMANSVNTAVKSLDKFVANCTTTNGSPPATNSPPFDINDYGTTAEKVGGMATNLTTLVLAANQSEAQISRLSSQATADAKGVINHAFRLGVLLVVLAAALFALILWIYRRATGR